MILQPAPETLRQAATSIVAALDARNAPALYRYMRDKEALADRLTEKKLAAFLNGPYAKRMAPFRPSSFRFGIDDDDMVTFTRSYLAPGGQKIAVIFVVQKTPQGPKLTPFFRPLVRTYFDTWLKPGAGGNAWAQGATLGGPALAKIGIKGMTDKLDGSSRFYTWPQWARAVR